MKSALKWVAGFIGLAVLVLALMIAFGDSAPPAPLNSINQVAAAVDHRDLPPIQTFVARDGTSLAYRAYPAAPNQLTILIHGSSADSAAMHAAGKALSTRGITAFALDIRGHGESGARGDIQYVGQLEDDLADFVSQLRATYPSAPITLVGHSAGGGFVLRVAGSPNGSLFSRYILLAPFLRYDAPTNRGADGGGWAKPFVPRMLALDVLHRIGIDWFAGLPVLAFAIPEEPNTSLTGTYSYRLSSNFRPHNDYLGDFRRSSTRIILLAGAEDELFFSDRFEQALAAVQQQVRIEIIPDVGHMAIVSDPRAIRMLVTAVR